MPKDLSISIDGPTASGKTTLGSYLAATFGCAFLDTGWTFRAIGYAIYHHALPSNDHWEMVLEHRPARYEPSPEPCMVEPERILLEGKDITDEIFDTCLESAVRSVASDPIWRARIQTYHASLIRPQLRIVAVGRDVALTLLPAASLHIVLTASLAVRRERRRAQYRNTPGRSIAVGSMTPRDVLKVEEIRKLPRFVEIDTNFLPPAAVGRAALRALETYSS